MFLFSQVVARIFPPGGGGGVRPIELQLRDDGAGFPDVTSGDGIYSAAFSAFAQVPGFYSVQVSADDNGGLARTLRPELLDQGKQLHKGPFAQGSTIF